MDYTDHATDAALVRRARVGDRAAFGMLVRRYENVAYASALAVSGDPDAARDAAQDAFLSAYLSIGQLREPERFGSWLRGIVRRRTVDALRRVRRIVYVSDGTAAYEVETAAASLRWDADGDYTRLLEGVECRISMAAAGEPTQNGYAERLICTIKEEEIALSDYKDFADAFAQIGRFLEDVYLHKRIHSALGYLTPAEFEQGWQQHHAATLPQNKREKTVQL